MSRSGGSRCRWRTASGERTPAYGHPLDAPASLRPVTEGVDPRRVVRRCVRGVSTEDEASAPSPARACAGPDQSSRNTSGRVRNPCSATSGANNGAIAAFQRAVTSASRMCAWVAAGSSHS